MEVENISDNNEINMDITSSESQEIITNRYIPPRQIRNKNIKSINITSEEEREFEKFILQTACDTEQCDGEPTPPFQSDTSVLECLHPYMSRIEQTKHNVSLALSKARTTYNSYKKNKLITDESSIRLQDKKERLKRIYHELREYDKQLDLRKKELNNNHLRRLERLKELNAEDSKLNEAASKFNMYYEKKYELLKAILEEEKERKDMNNQRHVDLMKRNQEISMREDKVKHIQKEIDMKEKEYKDMRTRVQLDSPSNKNIYVRKNSASSYNNSNNKHHNRNHSFGSYSNNKNKHNSLHQFNNNYDPINIDKNINTYNPLEHYIIDPQENNQETLDLLNQQITIKTSQLGELNKQSSDLRNETLAKLTELNNRLSNAEEREREILLLQKDLQNKLNEVNYKLNETNKISNNLKQQEDYINALRLTHRTIDNKLSSYEINEALNQTRTEINKKQLI